MLNQPASVQERYELKFLVSSEAIAPISRFIEKYCSMDPYSVEAPGHFYTSNNLYLDNRSFQLYQKNASAGPFSFNMRVRSYGETLQVPCYFEIKYKVRDFVRKKRSRVLAKDWMGLFSSDDFLLESDVALKKNLEEFIFLSRSYSCGPVLNVQYQRKAYMALGEGYARVNFDKELRYQKNNEWNFKTDVLSDPDDQVILELKYEKKMPLWMTALIHEFGLTPAVGGKYGKLLPSWTEDGVSSGDLFK